MRIKEIQSQTYYQIIRQHPVIYLKENEYFLQHFTVMNDIAKIIRFNVKIKKKKKKRIKLQNLNNFLK